MVPRVHLWYTAQGSARADAHSFSKSPFSSDTACANERMFNQSIFVQLFVHTKIIKEQVLVLERIAQMLTIYVSCALETVKMRSFFMIQKPMKSKLLYAHCARGNATAGEAGSVLGGHD